MCAMLSCIRVIPFGSTRTVPFPGMKYTERRLVPSMCNSCVQCSVLGTGEATARILHSVLGLLLQERHRGAGVCPKEGKEAAEGCKEQVL